ncbi:ferredoxin [Parafrankia discariae]|uniref:ferredoxin n=1 Tax=Parafrankia discariae TaxID=365528 RepID=UPI0004778CE1|nr:ferredoxin [Parafrankia discariae]
MKVVVDFKLCESNALCVGLAPTVFELDDNDYLNILDETPDEDLAKDVRAAVTACPKQAIKIVDD